MVQSRLGLISLVCLLLGPHLSCRVQSVLVPLLTTRPCLSQFRFLEVISRGPGRWKLITSLLADDLFCAKSVIFGGRGNRGKDSFPPSQNGGILAKGTLSELQFILVLSRSERVSLQGLFSLLSLLTSRITLMRVWFLVLMFISLGC